MPDRKIYTVIISSSSHPSETQGWLRFFDLLDFAALIVKRETGENMAQHPSFTCIYQCESPKRKNWVVCMWHSSTNNPTFTLLCQDKGLNREYIWMTMAVLHDSGGWSMGDMDILHRRGKIRAGILLCPP
jgi:hypothetical protein